MKSNLLKKLNKNMSVDRKLDRHRRQAEPEFYEREIGNNPYSSIDYVGGPEEPFQS